MVVSCCSEVSRCFALQDRITCVKHFSIQYVKATHMPKSAMTRSDDGSLVRKRIFSGLSIATRHTQLAGESSQDILEIPVDDVVVVQVLYASQNRTGRKELMFRLICRVIRRPIYRWPTNVRNVPKHRHGVSLREVSALADTFKEFSAHGELESEVVF